MGKKENKALMMLIASLREALDRMDASEEWESQEEFRCEVERLIEHYAVDE